MSKFMSNEDALVKLTAASAFAYAAHGSIHQVRDYNGEIYFNHLSRVARIIMDIIPASYDSVMATMVAYLHDVVEDTPITIEQIKVFFGKEVAEYVAEVTNPPKIDGKNRAERLADNLKKFETISVVSRNVKLADIIDNCSGIVTENPGFAKVYLKEKRQVIEVLKNGGHPVLYEKAKKIIDDFLGEENG